MTKRMLIDASHSEETRVVVLDGTRLEEFDLEAATRRPLKGNIYLAKVVRVEPSLQAAFVEYGGNRHGFLAFSEIHPDYYQIPVADRQRLLDMQAAEAREEAEAEEAQVRAEAKGETRGEARGETRAETAPRRGRPPRGEAAAEASAGMPEGSQEQVPDDAAPQLIDEAGADEAVAGVAADMPPDGGPLAAASPEPDPSSAGNAPLVLHAEHAGAATLPEAVVVIPPVVEAEEAATDTPMSEGEPPEPLMAVPNGAAPGDEPAPDLVPGPGNEGSGNEAAWAGAEADGRFGTEANDAPPPETMGGEGPEDGPEDGSEENGQDRRMPSRFMRHYKIQEVIRRRQIMLIQVVKEERGTKGAALTTYISLAGRFSVLMPNSPRGGGVSRKITSTTDRRRLREVIDELDMPDGMSLIVRTAGAQRPKPEIRRDCEYLLRLWDNIRDRTLASSAPALIYEEADLIKRSIRDVYARDVEEILVDGEEAFRDAREFMRMLMPQHVRKIQLHRDGGLFARQGVEAQLDAMHLPTVQLRSGGYIVINQTEALVAIDVNSGRSTRERHIEDTALRTNLEAADEIARQLRLRDLAGLIVIDFIDMESNRNDAMVERRVKDALRHDRARIQVGHISHFGLLEMSRQRLRPSLTETTFVTCQHCQGRGQVRSIENGALQVLRAIEEEGAKRRSGEIAVHVASSIALYLLNRKRDRLAQIEARYGMAVLFEPDDTLLPPALRIEKLRGFEPGQRPVDAAPAALRMDYAPEAEDDLEEAPDVVDTAPPEPRPRDARSRDPRAARGRDAMARGEAARPEPAPLEADGASAPTVAAERPEAYATDAEAAEAEAGARRKRRRRRRRPGVNGARPEGGAKAGSEGDAADGDDADAGFADDETEDAPFVAAMPAEDAVAAGGVGGGTPTEVPAEAQAEMAPGNTNGGIATNGDAAGDDAAGDDVTGDDAAGGDAAGGDAAGPRRRRRGRRGGGRTTGGPDATNNEAAAEQPAAPSRPPEPPKPRYSGPTPADPFAGHVDDILAAMEAAEVAAEAAMNRRNIPIAARPPLAAFRSAAIAGMTPADVAPAAPEPEAAPAAPETDRPAAREPAAEPNGTPRPDAPPPMADPEPALAEPAPRNGAAPVAEPVQQGPAIQPTIIAENDAQAPKRGGWWKR